MGKILLLVVVVGVVYLLIKRYKQRMDLADFPAKPVEDMVRCAHCAVNLPRGEAIYIQGDFFCTAEHQRLGKK